MALGVPNISFDLVTMGLRMARERRQNGWVKKTGKKTKVWTGYWYEYVTVDGTEKRRQKSDVLGSVTELTKGAAQDKLRDTIRGERPPETNATFGQLAKWYLKTSEGRWSKSTRGVMASIFERRILPQIGSRRAADIKPSEVQQALDAIAADGTASESLLKKCRTHIKAVFELAIEDEHLEKNPAKRLELPKHKPPSERFLTLDECQRLLSVSAGRDRLIVLVMMTLGLRPSELLALRADDVQPGRLRVDEASVDGRLGQTKTEGSKAIVPLPPQLESELKQYIKREGKSGTDFLFPSAAGTTIQQHNYLNRVLKPLGILAGIDLKEVKGKPSSGLNHQVLRRTTGTHFQKHGKVKDTQTLLRHSNAETTLKHYQKTLEESTISGVASWESELLGIERPAAKVLPFERKTG